MFVVNVEAAIFKNEKWLIVRRSEKEEHAAGALALVGGKVDNEGNSSDILERTLIREVEEEVGVTVSNPTYVNSSSFVTESGVAVVDIVFLCSFQTGEPFAKDPEEVASVAWMTTEEILNHTETPSYLKENIQLADQIVKSDPFSASV